MLKENAALLPDACDAALVGGGALFVTSSITPFYINPWVNNCPLLIMQPYQVFIVTYADTTDS